MSIRGPGLLAMMLGTALAACARTPAPDDAGPLRPQAAFPEAVYQRAAAAGRPVYDVDAAASQVLVLLARGGALADLGHDHVIRAGGMTGAAVIPDSSAGDARLDLRIPARGLEVDPPALRRRLGGAFAAGIPPDAAEDTRANMLGARVLDASRYPDIRVRLESVAGTFPYPVLTLSVALAGEVGQLTVPVRIERDGSRVHVSGVAAVDHQELGLAAFTAAGGALRVADPIVIVFRVTAVRR